MKIENDPYYGSNNLFADMSNLLPLLGKNNNITLGINLNRITLKINKRAVPDSEYESYINELKTVRYNSVKPSDCIKQSKYEKLIYVIENNSLELLSFFRSYGIQVSFKTRKYAGEVVLDIEITKENLEKFFNLVPGRITEKVKTMRSDGILNSEEHSNIVIGGIYKNVETNENMICLHYDPNSFGAEAKMAGMNTEHVLIDNLEFLI